MKKKIFVGALILALVSAVAFAGTLSGVSWNFSESGGYTTVTNNNSYGVTVFLVVSHTNRNYGSEWIEAGDSTRIDADVKVSQVSRIKKAN